MLFQRRSRSGSGRLSGRRRPGTREAIIQFWEWWPSVRPRLTTAIDAGDGGAPLANEIGERVAAIHPKLDWELGKGLVARHDFTVSAGGNPELRATAARWLALAPPADDVWEFHDSRQAIPVFDTMRLQIGPHDLEMGETRFGLTRRQHGIDVVVHHALFAEMPEEQRLQIAFLCLDWALGEQAVEVWIGEIGAASTPPAEVDTVDGLRSAVADLADQHREGQWAVLSGVGDHAGMAVAQVPLRAARWPRFDTHVALRLPYADRGNGLPTDEALEALRSFEDTATAMLGPDGELLAHESVRGVRTLHYYVDGEADASARLTAAASGWRGARATSTPDPSLQAIRHLDADR